MRQQYYSVTGWKTKQQAQYNNELIFYTCNTYIQYILSLKFSQPFSNQRTINIEYSQHSNKTTTFSGFNTMYFLLSAVTQHSTVLLYVSTDHEPTCIGRACWKIIEQRDASIRSQRSMFYTYPFEITEEKMYIYLSIFSDLLICLASFLTERIRDKKLCGQN